MHSTTHAMNIFVRAVQTNSFVGAARSLMIDRSAVSRAIKALEQELGVLLFARSTRALKLTMEGERFYRDCIQILAKLEQATQQFHVNLRSPRGQLKVGITPALGRRILMRAIPPFQRQYPEVEMVMLGVDGVPEIEERGIDVLVRSVRQPPEAWWATSGAARLGYAKTSAVAICSLRISRVSRKFWEASHSG